MMSTNSPVLFSIQRAHLTVTHSRVVTSLQLTFIAFEIKQETCRAALYPSQGLQVFSSAFLHPSICHSLHVFKTTNYVVSGVIFEFCNPLNGNIPISKNANFEAKKLSVYYKAFHSSKTGYLG